MSFALCPLVYLSVLCDKEFRLWMLCEHRQAVAHTSLLLQSHQSLFCPLVIAFKGRMIWEILHQLLIQLKLSLLRSFKHSLNHYG